MSCASVDVSCDVSSDTWSSMRMPAKPAFMNPLTVRFTFRALPKPVSPSPITGSACVASKQFLQCHQIDCYHFSSAGSSPGKLLGERIDMSERQDCMMHVYRPHLP